MVFDWEIVFDEERRMDDISDITDEEEVHDKIGWYLLLIKQM
jgi:hypothetical protein